MSVISQTQPRLRLPDQVTIDFGPAPLLAQSFLSLDRAMREQGVLVPAIRPPSVAPGSARLRATVMATHTDEHIDRAIEAFAVAREGANTALVTEL